MSNSDGVGNLPALVERTAAESDWRALEQRAADADQLRARVSEMERALMVAENRAGQSGDPAAALAEGLLPVLDAFSAALVAARSGQDYGAIVAGVQLAEQEMLRVLGLFGVERLETLPGAAFDLDLHQTLDDLEGLVAEQPVITELLRAGYLKDSQVLRRAIVKIAD